MGNETTIRKADERRYPINSHDGYGFYAGVTPDNKQVLMGLAYPNLVAFVFDWNGNLLEENKRPLTLFEGVDPPYGILVYDDQILTQIVTWQQELGFHSSTINVRKFYSRQFGFGIQDYPSHFAETLSDPQETDEERDSIRDSMKQWDADQQFVLWWGNDYWLDGSGEVVSS